MIKLAEMTDLEKILQITHDTISEIYSHYYAKGVVQFFMEHHSRENVYRILRIELYGCWKKMMA